MEKGHAAKSYDKRVAALNLFLGLPLCHSGETNVKGKQSNLYQFGILVLIFPICMHMFNFITNRSPVDFSGLFVIVKLRSMYSNVSRTEASM